jgi:hypothetical protein
MSNAIDYINDAKGHGRKVVEGIYTILVGVNGRRDGE